MLPPKTPLPPPSNAWPWPWPSPPSHPPKPLPQTPPPSLNLSHLLRLSARYRDLNSTKSIHALISKSHTSTNNSYDSGQTPLLNSLIWAYSKFNRLSDARNVFDKMPAPDIASFDYLLSAYANNDQQTAAFSLFYQMRHLGFLPSAFAFVTLLMSCVRGANFRLGAQVHALALKTCHCSCLYVGNVLMGMYVSWGRFGDAVKVFDEMPQRDVSSWNVVISAMVKSERYSEAFELFREMRIGGECGDRISVSTLLTAVVEGFTLREGEAVHAYAVKIGSGLDLSVGNALVRLYTRFGGVEDVVRVFDRMPERDMITWTGMLNGYMEFGFVELGIETFKKMPERNVLSCNALLAGLCKNGEGVRGLLLFQEILKIDKEIDDITVTNVVTACAMVGDREKSEQIHGFVIKTGFGSNACVEAALLDMCARCDRMEDAEDIYARTMQKGFSPITWDSLISARARNGQLEEALSLFHEGLKRVDSLEAIDEFTLTTVLGACGTLGFAEMGEQIHGFALKSNGVVDIGVGNAIMSTYSKCGNLDDAVAFFNQMPRKDLVSWNALINSFLLHRKGDEALDVWSEMERLGENPDSITFLHIISACKFTESNSIDTCQELFSLMMSSYRLNPASEHYAAMVDVLSYWDEFDEAEKLIESMDCKPDALVWRALLNNCILRSKVTLGKQAIQRFLAIEPNDPSTYALISNLYSASGRWHCSDRARQEMREKGLKKNPARSWIVHNNTVHTFYGRENSHPQSKDIHSGLEVLILECMKAGYEPDTSFVLQEAEEYQKQHFLLYHSAKLAVAYGVLIGKAKEEVRIAKNVKLCGDCHEFMKVVSSVTGRRILVRDGSGFHKFEGGKCLCADSW